MYVPTNEYNYENEESVSWEEFEDLEFPDFVQNRTKDDYTKEISELAKRLSDLTGITVPSMLNDEFFNKTNKAIDLMVQIIENMQQDQVQAKKHPLYPQVFMSRTLKGQKGPGFEFWSKRNHKSSGPGKFAKKLASKKESRDGEVEVQTELDELEQAERIEDEFND